MIKKTHLDYGRDAIIFPFIPEDSYWTKILWDMESDNIYFNDFTNYVSTKYGANDVEMKDLYDKYVYVLLYGWD